MEIGRYLKNYTMFCTIQIFSIENCDKVNIYKKNSTYNIAAYTRISFFKYAQFAFQTVVIQNFTFFDTIFVKIVQIIKKISV